MPIILKSTILLIRALSSHILFHVFSLHLIFSLDLGDHQLGVTLHSVMKASYFALLFNALKLTMIAYFNGFSPLAGVNTNPALNLSMYENPSVKVLSLVLLALLIPQ